MTGPMDTLGDRMRQLEAAGWIEQHGKDTEPDVVDVVKRLRTT